MDKLHRTPPESYPSIIDRRLQQIRFTIEDLKLGWSCCVLFTKY